MKYTEWLVQEFPELADSSSVKRFNYVKEAKAETRRLRIMASIPKTLCTFILGYCIGFAFKKYTNFDLGVVIVIAVTFSVLVFGAFSNKLEDRIIQKKLTELVKRDSE
ncbi:hypothetical protein [Alteromonas gilva]|uniref:Uncharacterized protein n=1 Tax=Alteromonas gilva TaxID=2987522 RepID=A0ABT5KX88_9ALTE|nr:hypothetical protein [Alteromonas gilva]MDC8829380.1 hypothetical protein [Alteromonas gilva]